MKPVLENIDAELDAIKNDGLYRMLRTGNVNTSHITVRGKRMINLCSNDYLGIKPTRLDILQMQSSSRLVSGNDSSYELLEKVIAKHRRQQAALVFPTGYMANLGVITAMVQRGDTVLSDELNHASIIDACRLGGAKIRVYRHNDIDDLKKNIPGSKGRVFIITEGVFSMDGDLARLDEIVELAQKSDIVTILDDAHGDFVTGKGRGTAAHFGVARHVDVHVSSLSKGLGSFGGYVASQQNVTNYCINKSRQFIYTSALPNALVIHALRRMQKDHTRRRKKLEKSIARLIRGLGDLGYQTGSQSHIIPIIIGNEKTTVRLGRYLMSRGLFAQPIRYPTVAKGSARIRISVTAWLDVEEIDYTLDVLKDARKKFGQG